MSNNAYMCTSDTPERGPRNGRVSRFAAYHLPVAWLALFDVVNVRSVTLAPGVDFTTFDTEALPRVVPHLVRATETALAAIRSRRSWMLKHFPRLDVAWIDMLELELVAAEQPYVHLHTWELASCVTPNFEDWREELVRMLGMFEEEPTPFSDAEGDGSLPIEEAMRLIRRSGWDNYLLRFGVPQLGSQSSADGFIGVA